MPLTAAATRTAMDVLPTENANPTFVTVDLTFRGVTFDPLDLYDMLARQYGTAATLSTNLTGAQNDLTFTARSKGATGNDITVRYLDPAGNNQALAVSVLANAITVSLATDGGGAITSTAALVRAAINDSATASALISAANKAANDGTGVVTAMAATALAAGAGVVTTPKDAVGQGAYVFEVSA